MDNKKILDIELELFGKSLVLDFLDVTKFVDVTEDEEDYYYKYEDRNGTAYESSAVVGPLFLKYVLKDKEYSTLEKMFYNNKLDLNDFDFLKENDLKYKKRIILKVIDGVVGLYWLDSIKTQNGKYYLLLNSLFTDKLFKVELNGNPFNDPRILELIFLKPKNYKKKFLNDNLFLKNINKEDRKNFLFGVNNHRIYQWYLLNSRMFEHIVKRKEYLIYDKKDKLVLSGFFDYEDLEYILSEMISKIRSKGLSKVVILNTNKLINKVEKNNICLALKEQILLNFPYVQEIKF